MLLELVDGGIISIESDDDFIKGCCDTCDYGDTFVNYYSIEMVCHSVEINVSDEDNYALSHGSIMNIILPNIDKIQAMTEKQFIEWIEIKSKDIAVYAEVSVGSVEIQ